MGHSVIRVSLQQFLAEYTRCENIEESCLIPIRERLSAVFKKAEDSDEICAALCAAFNDALPPSSSYVAKKAATDPDPGPVPTRRLALYDKTFDSDLTGTTVEELVETPNGIAWNICTTLVKYRSKRDPFISSEPNPEVCEQIVETFRHQQREFAFLITTFGRKARLSRWDNAGVVVTDVFDYVKDPAPLLNFIRWLSRASRTEQGFDTSVSPADEHQVEDLREYRCHDTKNEYEQRFIDEMLEDPILYQMECEVLPDRPLESWCKPFEGQKLTLIIGKPRVWSSSPYGRTTKGYFGYAVGLKRLLFVKISRRSRSESSEATPEIERYSELYSAGVPHIPILVAGHHTEHSTKILVDTCESSTTRTQEPHRIPKRKNQVRTVLVFETLCIPLSEYSTSASLIKVLHDAVKAHECAWNNAAILHGDISTGNILIDIHSPDMQLPNGVLSDWDLSQKWNPDDPESRATQSGTWAFMSGPSLRYPLKPAELSDDLESVVHVLDYCALRFHHTTYSDESTWDPDSPGYNPYGMLSNFVSDFFHEKVRSDGYCYGGKNKFYAYDLSRGGSNLDWWLTAKDYFSRFVGRLHKLCALHYASIDKEFLSRYSEREQAVRKMTRSSDDSEDSFFPYRRPHVEIRRPEDPFKSHARILEVFEMASGEIEDFVAKNGGVKEDKTPDQFLNLPLKAWVHRLSASSFTSECSKRSRATPESDIEQGSPQGPPNKRFKSSSHSPEDSE